jgi:hypothetical protein
MYCFITEENTFRFKYKIQNLTFYILVQQLAITGYGVVSHKASHTLRTLLSIVLSSEFIPDSPTTALWQL